MLFNSESDYKLSYQLSELNEKFLKSEAERSILEAKFLHLQEVYKNEEGRKLAIFRDKYNQFLENCKERNIRNESILKSLQKLENGANAVFAKTERLKQLRSHYDAYLSRAMPLWRHPDALEDTGVPTTWIREPRLVPPCAHPAMLLPGGGAVMLPVQNNIPPPVYPHSALLPRQVENKRLDSKSLPSPSSKVIATLGKAGEIMMQELGMLENNTLKYTHLSLPNILPSPPVFYQPYQLPIYVPPAPTYYTNPNFNIPYQQSMASLPLQEPFSPQRPQEYSSRLQTDQNFDPYIKNLKQTLNEEEKSRKNYKDENEPTIYPSDYHKNGSPYDRRKISKDNYEIECLKAETSNYDDDLNLSDDDVLDSAITKPQNPYQSISLRSKQAPIQNSEKLKSTLNMKSISETSDYPRSKSKPFNNAMHTAKIVEVEHKKSIDELKAMLSVETDESIPDMYMPGESDLGMLGDEDVPDDFNEQNFPDSHYDQRYQNDISRNVILEEDEDEEDFPPATRRDDWQSNRSQQFQRNMPDNYSIVDARRNEPLPNEKYPNTSFEELTNQKSAMSPDSRIQQTKPREATRPGSGGKRSPSPTLAQNYQSVGNRKTGKTNDNQSNPGNNVQPPQMQYEETKAPMTLERVSSYQDFDSSVDNRLPKEPLTNQSINQMQSNNSFVGNQEAHQYQNEYNEYSSPDQPLAQISNGYEEHYDQYDTPTDVNGYIDHLSNQPQNQVVVAPDDYSANYDARDHLQNNMQQHFREDEPNNYAAMQEMEPRDPNLDYPDHYNEQQYAEYSQGQVHDGLQYTQDNREYYPPHEGNNEEIYQQQSYIPEENRDHIEPYQERSNEQYQEPAYNTEGYREQPYPDITPLEQISNEYVPSPKINPYEYQQEIVGDFNPKAAVVDQPLHEEPVVQNLQPPQLTKIEETEDLQEFIPQQQPNLDVIQPLQVVEEKPRSSPQKTPQRSPLQRRQSSISQQSPQRQKQGQKGSQQKSQSRQSPKKSDRPQQNSPKKPLTPEPQPPPSVMTQLIDSESESYQVEPSAQNPDDSDFDFSIGK